MTNTFGIPTGPIESPPAGFRPDDEQSVILQDTLRAAGVELGAYDKRIVDWLSGWEWSTVATVASWISRASSNSESRPAVRVLPRTTATCRDYLARFAAAQDAGTPVHVYRDPAKPGSGVSRPALDRLRGNGQPENALVELGEYQPLRGRPVLVTDLGRAVLAAHTTEA